MNALFKTNLQYGFAKCSIDLSTIEVEDEKIYELFSYLLRCKKLLQFDWLRAVVFQLNLKHLHVKITNLLLVVV